jgi:hypothetical protein
LLRLHRLIAAADSAVDAVNAVGSVNAAVGSVDAVGSVAVVDRLRFRPVYDLLGKR